MNKLIFLVFLVCLTIGCENIENQKKQKTSTNLDLSYSDGQANFFSIKFTHENKVFVKEHFTQIQHDLDIQIIDECYYSFITRYDRIKLDSFVNEINFFLLDSSYYQPTTNIRYQLFIEMNSRKRPIYIHSKNIPPQLNYLCKWIVSLKKNLKLIDIDSTLKFNSLIDFLPPPVNRPSINIIDPKPYRQPLTLHWR